MFGLLFFIFIGIISLTIGLICKLLISSVKIFATIIGIYLGISVFIILITSSFILLIPVLLVFLGIIIGKNINNQRK